MRYLGVSTLCVGTPGKWSVCFCLDPARLNQALVRPVHRSPTVNAISPKLSNTRHLSLIDVGLGYYNLNLDKSHHTYPHLHFSLVGTDRQDYYSYWPQQATCSSINIDYIFKELPNVFGNADDILICRI